MVWTQTGSTYSNWFKTELVRTQMGSNLHWFEQVRAQFNQFELQQGWTFQTPTGSNSTSSNFSKSNLFELSGLQFVQAFRTPIGLNFSNTNWFKLLIKVRYKELLSVMLLLEEIALLTIPTSPTLLLPYCCGRQKRLVQYGISPAWYISITISLVFIYYDHIIMIMATYPLAWRSLLAWVKHCSE